MIKLILLVMIGGCCFVFGCSMYSADKQVKDFIPGIYVTEWTTAFTAGRDTMHIERLTEKGSASYQLTRRTYLLSQGQPQYKLVHWVGIYNSNNKTLLVNNNGRILSFDLESKQMKMGSTTYRKL